MWGQHGRERCDESCNIWVSCDLIVFYFFHYRHLWSQFLFQPWSWISCARHYTATELIMSMPLVSTDPIQLVKTEVLNHMPRPLAVTTDAWGEEKKAVSWCNRTLIRNTQRHRPPVSNRWYDFTSMSNPLRGTQFSLRCDFWQFSPSSPAAKQLHIELCSKLHLPAVPVLANFASWNMSLAKGRGNSFHLAPQLLT